MFQSEKKMSRSFKSFLSKSLYNDRNYKIIKEPSGLFGEPDYLVVDYFARKLSLIVAFELKLSNWKRAMGQAFKYLHYSNLSLVVLDEHYVRPALKNIDRFKHFNIGLCSFSENSDFFVYYIPDCIIPFSERLSHKVGTYSLKKKRVRLEFSGFMESTNPLHDYSHS